MPIYLLLVEAGRERRGVCGWFRGVRESRERGRERNNGGVGERSRVSNFKPVKLLCFTPPSDFFCSCSLYRRFVSCNFHSTSTTISGFRWYHAVCFLKKLHLSEFFLFVPPFDSPKLLSLVGGNSVFLGDTRDKWPFEPFQSRVFPISPSPSLLKNSVFLFIDSIRCSLLMLFSDYENTRYVKFGIFC